MFFQVVVKIPVSRKVKSEKWMNESMDEDFLHDTNHHPVLRRMMIAMHWFYLYRYTSPRFPTRPCSYRMKTWFQVTSLNTLFMPMIIANENVVPSNLIRYPIHAQKPQSIPIIIPNENVVPSNLIQYPIHAQEEPSMPTVILKRMTIAVHQLPKIDIQS